MTHVQPKQPKHHNQLLMLLLLIANKRLGHNRMWSLLKLVLQQPPNPMNAGQHHNQSLSYRTNTLDVLYARRILHRVRMSGFYLVTINIILQVLTLGC